MQATFATNGAQIFTIVKYDKAKRDRVEVASFMSHEVTVAEFAKFVAATNYETDAEKFGWSGVFNMKMGAWANVNGASWRHPDGPASQANPLPPSCPRCERLRVCQGLEV